MKKIGLVVFLSVILFSCKDRGIEDSKGKLRLINASYITGDINMDIEYAPVFSSNVQYLNYSLFREFIAGKRKLQIKNASGGVIVDTFITIEENKTYSAFLYDSAGTVRYKLLNEQFFSPGGSNCKVRFLHLSNDAPAVNMVQQFDTTFRFDNYVNGMNSEYMSMATGPQQFDVKTVSGNNTIYSNLFEYEPGFLYTLYLKGNVSSQGNDSLGIFIITDNGNY